MVTRRRPESPARRGRIANPRFRFRDTAGRFRAGTLAERTALDFADAQSQYFAGRVAGSPIEYGVFTGPRTGRRFAIRRGAVVPLDGKMIARQIESAADAASDYLLKELRRSSPVDTGLLRSRWQIADNAVVNDVPYVFDTEYRNRSSKGYIRRAVAKTLRAMGQQHSRQAFRPRPSTITIKM